MAKQIYYVQSCDEWKSTDTMRIEMVTTSIRKLKTFIAKKIEKGDYEYCDSEMNSKKQAAVFRSDFDNLDRYTINCKLRYASFEYVYDGEEL